MAALVSLLFIAIIPIYCNFTIFFLVSQQKYLLNEKFLKFHSKLMQKFRVDIFGLGYA